MLKQLSKKISAVMVLLVFVVTAFAAFPVNTVEASAYSRVAHKVTNNVKKHTESKIESNAKRTIKREVDRIINLIDPNSPESRRLNAKQLLYSLPYGESVILVTGTKASTLRRVIKEMPLYDYVGPAKSQYGKTVGLRVYRYQNVEEMLSDE